MTASSAPAQWDLESRPTAASDGAQQQLSLHEESEALAPAPPLPDPSVRAVSTRARLPRDDSPHGTLHTMSRRLAAEHASAKPLAEWQGYVTRIEDDHLHAMMEGVFGTGVEGKTHEAVIPLPEVSPDDRALVREGAYFRLSVAYAMSQRFGGTFTRTSTLVFRRLPAYQANDLARAREMARELLAGIRLE